MYTEEMFYGIDCDNCGESYEDGMNGYSYWMDKQSALDEISDDGWHSDGDIHYCPDCHSFNDEDELTVNTGRSKK